MPKIFLMYYHFVFSYISDDLDANSYETSIDGSEIDLSPISEEILGFCEQQLKRGHTRADYAELLKLVMIFLGGTPSSGISFRAPGAFHHARWMAKAIYCLKMYLFRDQFVLTAREIKGIRDICQFIVRLYVKAWFTAPLAASAPNFDFNFLIELQNYNETDKDISRVAVKKMCGHLWYLAEEVVGLSFFDENIPLNVKEKMVESFRGNQPEAEEDGHCRDRNIIQPKDVSSLTTKTMEYFVSKKTKSFFERFDISSDFMDYEPSSWPQCPSYITGLQAVQKIIVVNDVSERKVKLMEEFNSILTNDEEQKQFLLLTVDQYRKNFPSHTKTSLVSGSNND